MTGAEIFTRASYCAQARAAFLSLAQRYAHLGTSANDLRCKVAAADCEAEIITLAQQAEILAQLEATHQPEVAS